MNIDIQGKSKCTMGSREGEQQALCGLAEYFHGVSCFVPAIHCLEASLLVPAPARVEARIRLRLGQLYFYHTTGSQQARMHVDKANLILQQTTGMDEVRYEAVKLLVDMHRAHGETRAAKALLKNVLDQGVSNPTYYYQLALQAAAVCGEDGETAAATAVLKQGQVVAGNNRNIYMQTLLLLSEAQLHLMAWNQEALGPAMENGKRAVDMVVAAAQNGHVTQRQSDGLVVYYNVLRVLHLARLGHTKQLPVYVTALQGKLVQGTLAESAQDDDAGREIGQAEWMDSKRLFGVVFVITVMADMYAGRLRKGAKHGQQALELIAVQLRELQAGECSDALKRRGWPWIQQTQMLLQTLRFVVWEHMVAIHVLMGSPCEALEVLSQMRHALDTNKTLFDMEHRVLVHLLTGAYAASVGDPHTADRHFNIAWERTNRPEIKMLATLHMITISLWKGTPIDHNRLNTLMERLRVGSCGRLSRVLQSAEFFVTGLYSQYIAQTATDARGQLTECLKISSEFDLQKFTALSLLQIAQLSLTAGRLESAESHTEAYGMADPGYRLAKKTGEMSLFAAACGTLSECFLASGNGEEASRVQGEGRAAMAALAQARNKALASPHHASLTQWEL